MNGRLSILIVSAFLTTTLIPSDVPATDVVVINGRPVDSWAYQLQGPGGTDLGLDGLAALDADLAVIDYSRDGGEAGEFEAAEVGALRTSGAGKLALSYVSIGEASVGRFYDQNPGGDTSPFSTPEADPLLGPENPDWPGCFKVRYWMADWRDIIFGDSPLPEWVAATQDPQRRNYLDRVIDQGFDGVYLDIVDGYQAFNQEGDGTRPSAALDMILFIIDMAQWARGLNADFLVFPQNGECVWSDALWDLDTGSDELDDPDPYILLQGGLLYLDGDDDGLVDPEDRSIDFLDTDGTDSISSGEIEAAFFGAIDGLGVEDFFFKGAKDEDNLFVDDLAYGDWRTDDFKWTADNFLAYDSYGVPLFIVEYLTDAYVYGQTQFEAMVTDTFSFSNPDITTDSDSPAFTDEELHSLDIVPFRAPSRELDLLPGQGEPTCFVGIVLG